MSTPFIPLEKATKGNHREPLQNKTCGFPKCKETFLGTGKSRYCVEHRQRKYRKIIDSGKIAAKKADEDANNPNQIIKHQYNETTLIRQKCGLEGCNNEFEFKIFPNVFVFPKFCKHHRNEFKRKLFINGQSK